MHALSQRHDRSVPGPGVLAKLTINEFQLQNVTKPTAGLHLCECRTLIRYVSSQSVKSDAVRPEHPFGCVLDSKSVDREVLSAPLSVGRHRMLARVLILFLRSPGACDVFRGYGWR